MLEIQQTDKEEEGEAGLEKCPDYLLIYICGFLSFSDGWNVRGVNRKWASAVQQWDLLNSSLHFYDAECINHYISPLFETIQSLAPFPIQFDTVVDQCANVVKQSIEINISSSPYSVALLSKKKDGLRYFVSENCGLYFRSHSTKWIENTLWFDPSLSCNRSDTGANSDVDDDDINDHDFGEEEEDDGFRYYGNDNDINDDNDDVEMGIPRYNKYKDEREEDDEDEDEDEDDDDDEIEKREVGYYNTSREIARTRDELGYLNLLDDSD